MLDMCRQALAISENTYCMYVETGGAPHMADIGSVDRN